MKKSLIIAILILSILIPLVNSACDVNVSLINQDPYPATPGESVKLVFQINGVNDPDCETVKFEVKESYPFTIDPESTNPLTINCGIYAKNYSSFYIAPYKIRIDKDALEGDTPLEVGYISSAISETSFSGEKLEELNIYIEDARADFEIYIKDYNYNTRALTFEILNIADDDVEALTIEIPEQENIEVKGTNKVVVGDLDSNEYTTADFEAITKNGQINLKISYTDSTDTRRQINKTVQFDSKYFKGLTRDKSAVHPAVYIIIIGIIGFISWFLYKRYKKKKHKYQIKD